MNLKNISFNKKNLENDYHINFSKILLDRNGNYYYLEFNEPKLLHELPDLFLSKKNIILVYEKIGCNIFYNGIARKII